jgi:hypothetical protein
MFKDREKMYQVYHTILSMALTWALILGIDGYYVLKVHVVVSALFSLVLAALIYLFDVNRRNMVSYLIVLSFFPVAGLFFWIRGINPAAWIGSIADWVMEYDRTEETYAASPAHFLLFGIALLSTVLFYLL